MKGYQVIAIMLGAALLVAGLWGLGVVIVACALYDRFVSYG